MGKKKPKISETTPKRKNFLHKEAVFSKEQGRTIEQMLNDALGGMSQVGSRMQEGANSGEKRFINYHLLHSTQNGPMYGCEFLAFETGADQSIIELQEGATELSVDAVPAGEDKEFIGGSVYFGVKGNHVIFFQSTSLRSIELEAHLNWLIREKAKLIDPETILTLNDHISTKTRHKIKGVKGIKMSSPLVGKSVAIAPNKMADGAGEISIVPKGNPWESLKAIFGNAFEMPTHFKAEDLTQLQELEIQIYLRWKGRHDEDENDFLDGLANQMRHVDDQIDYSIDTKNGEFSKDKFKLNKDHQVAWTDRGRPRFDDLFPKMALWLETLVKEGKVDP